MAINWDKINQIATGKQEKKKTDIDWEKINSMFATKEVEQQPQSVWRNVPTAKDWTKTLPMSIAKKNTSKIEKAQEEAGKAKKKSDWLNSPLGTAVETIKGLPAAAKHLLAEIPAREVVGAKIQGTGGVYKPKTAFEKFLLGKEPVKELSVQGQEVLEGFGVKKETSEKWGLPLGGMFLATDMVWPGGKTSAVKTLTKINKATGAFSFLKKAGVAEDIAKEYAPVIAKAKTEKAVGVAVDTMENLQKQIKTTQTVKPAVSTADDLTSIMQREPRNILPMVIQGDNFILGEAKTLPANTKTLRKDLKQQIKATKQELHNAEIAQQKAIKLEIKQREIRNEAINNINQEHGNTERIIESLKKKNLSDEDIKNIVLEDSTKLVDTIKVKRNPDKSLAATITKQDIQSIKDTYKETISTQKWIKKGIAEDIADKGAGIAKIYELPKLYFERKGLKQIYEPMIEAGRGAEIMKTSFLQKFKDADLFKKGGWFTADDFKLSSFESKNIGKYYLTRQGKDFGVKITDLTSKEKKFVDIFDSIIKETEERFYRVAQKNGKTPGKVENYAPIMTKSDIELIDQGGTMDWLIRKHPAFFSLKERVKKAPLEIYETDYKKVVSSWLDGITKFISYGDTAPDIKYLIDSDEFASIVKREDIGEIKKWFQDIMTPQIPVTAGGKSIDALSRLLRKGVAISSLGLNYASVVKQALTQIPISIIEKAPPKLASQYAKAFGINVANMPSITKRSGDIAISDLQGKIGRIFTGGLTKFDRINAQLSLNSLLDKEYGNVLKEGVPITPKIQNYIEKTAQDKLDMWYGGFFGGQKPEAFRNSFGQFVNMFIYPLTSQLNGFYKTIAKEKGITQAQKVGEVMGAATAIAYLEVAISDLSFQWSDEQEMTKDVLQSLAGNIPIAGQITYSFLNDKELQVSPGISGIVNLIKKINDDGFLSEETGFAVAELAGLPKQIRRIREGIQIINEGGIKDVNGKILAPVETADEQIRSILRGKYGSLAAKDWVRNIGESAEERRWFVPQVEFLQNGDYERKAELYLQFDKDERKYLRMFLSEGQQEKLLKELQK